MRTFVTSVSAMRCVVLFTLHSPSPVIVRRSTDSDISMPNVPNWPAWMHSLFWQSWKKVRPLGAIIGRTTPTWQCMANCQDWKRAGGCARFLNTAVFLQNTFFWHQNHKNAPLTDFLGGFLRLQLIFSGGLASKNPNQFDHNTIINRVQVQQK